VSVEGWKAEIGEGQRGLSRTDEERMGA